MWGKTYRSEGSEQIEVGSPFDKELKAFENEALVLVDSRDPTIPRAELLTSFVHGRIRYAEDDEYNGPGQLLRAIYARRKKPMLGEFIRDRAGKCREIGLTLHRVLHRSGKKNKFVTGYPGNSDGKKHAWVEYDDTKTGEEMVADATENFVLPKKVAYALRYGGVTNVQVFDFS